MKLAFPTFGIVLYSEGKNTNYPHLVIFFQKIAALIGQYSAAIFFIKQSGASNQY
jgi:hypothetical protein